MKAKQIRQAFLNFFERQQHTVVSSSSLIPANDPTLLFANAGMNQFKDVFTGLEKRPYKRATSSQKCVRAGGKHNDLQHVGYTPRHHTFFEMLGNFSFGDYFKEDAIKFAWDLLINDLKLPKEKLWITVFREDDEAEKLWQKIAKVDPRRIIRMDEKDNFWAMGETGPCGPCSEIHFDLRKPGEEPEARPDTDEDLFLEIWNLVFMQYNRDQKGELTPLPRPSIDTGAGLERLAAVCQGVASNYETDLFLPIIAKVEQLCGLKLKDAEGDKRAAFRVIADHARCCSFLIADGVRPSNEGRGYVLRQIARRAISYASHLNLKPPFMFDVCQAAIAEMQETYPELKKAGKIIETVLKTEEEKFAEVIKTEQKLIENDLKHLKRELPYSAKETESHRIDIPRADHTLLACCSFKNKKGTVVETGLATFNDFQTHGIPLIMQVDSWQVLSSEFSGYTFAVDEEDFWRQLKRHRETAQGTWKTDQLMAGVTDELLKEISAKKLQTEFSGYDKQQDQAQLLAIIEDGSLVQKATAGKSNGLIFDRTPFYGEAGGQIGDSGKISGKKTGFTVDKTQRLLPTTWVHWGSLDKGQLAVGDKLTLAVDPSRRQTQRHHTATHLLHEALRRTLGEHINQAGSLVAPDRLRFDFTHPGRLSAAELQKIEKQVNEKIAADIPLTTSLMSLEKAQKSGARALFGEKYEDDVRVVGIGDFSKELCGGTHVNRTGEIERYLILSESSIASGVRRIEAVAGQPATAYVKELQNNLRQYCLRLKVKNDDQGRQHLQGLIEYNKQLRKGQPAKLPEISAANKAGKSTAKDLESNNLLTWLTAVNQLRSDLSQYRQLLKAGSDAEALARLDKLESENKQLQQQKPGSSLDVDELAADSKNINGLKLIAASLGEGDHKILRETADRLMEKIGQGIVALGAAKDGKAYLVVKVSKDLSKQYPAGQLIKQLAAEVGGSGGGRPDMAQAGGTKPENLAQAFRKLESYLRQ